MSVLKLARMGEPILRRRARPVSEAERGSEEFRIFVSDLIETMRSVSGAGLSAPQVFDERSVVVIEVSKNQRYPTFPELPLRVLINPVITPLFEGRDEVVKIYEGCLSVPGLRAQVTRPARVRLSALDLEGNPIVEEWQGVAAAIVQHEVDHLEGTLFVDRAEPKTFCFMEEMLMYVPSDQRVITS